MPREFSRARRVAEQIQRELAIIVQQEVKDPRIGMVTISGVDLTPDLAHARVFVTVLKENEDTAESVKILNNAAGYIRHELSRNMKLRTTPDLRFIYDETSVRGARLTSLINSVSTDHQHEE
ncbi:MAG: 30S ribosome-binding factor RbfA [Gammaproteobacteria bacterium]